jgi:hypothetical protein
MFETRNDIWICYVDKGKPLYDYMVNNFDTMFDGPTKIKHFHNKFWMDGLDDYPEHLEVINDEHIQPELIKWINQEYTNGYLSMIIGSHLETLTT